MRLSLLIFLGLCLIAGCRSAEGDYEYDDEPAPAPVTPAPARPGRLGSLLSARSRAPVGRKVPVNENKKATTTTTQKPVEQPAEEEFIEDEEAVEEGSQEQEEPVTTTTEASKKLRMGVRPFRSNDDLLAALKRRRAEAGTRKKEQPSTQAPEPTTAKAKSTGRKSSSVNETSKSTGRGRFGSSSRAKAQEEVQETQQDEVKATKPYRRLRN